MNILDFAPTHLAQVTDLHPQYFIKAKLDDLSEKPIVIQVFLISRYQ